MAENSLQRAFVVLRGLVYSAGFVLLWSWLAVSVRRLDPRWPVGLPASLRPAGWLIAVAGALLAAACIATFVIRGRGTPAPFDPPRQFVATGPYRFVRNPMYLGASGVLLGAGLVLQSLSIAGLAVAFLLTAHLFVLLYEEPALLRSFGDDYRRYKSSVRRWWPRFSH